MFDLVYMLAKGRSFQTKPDLLPKAADQRRKPGAMSGMAGSELRRCVKV